MPPTEAKGLCPGCRVDSTTGTGVLPISPITPTAEVSGPTSPLPCPAISGSGPQGGSWSP